MPSPSQSQRLLLSNRCERQANRPAQALRLLVQPRAFAFPLSLLPSANHMHFFVFHGFRQGRTCPTRPGVRLLGGLLPSARPSLPLLGRPRACLAVCPCGAKWLPRLPTGVPSSDYFFRPPVGCAEKLHFVRAPPFVRRACFNKGSGAGPPHPATGSTETATAAPSPSRPRRRLLRSRPGVTFANGDFSSVIAISVQPSIFSPGVGPRTPHSREERGYAASGPLSVRAGKLFLLRWVCINYMITSVAPYIRAWIETHHSPFLLKALAAKRLARAFFIPLKAIPRLFPATGACLAQ